MRKLVWNTPESKRHEGGVDRGVLYPTKGPGIAWNGLISVKESPEGGEVESYYFNGVKTFDDKSSFDFSATLRAFSFPQEFSLCEGEAEVIPGFILTRQPPTRFGLSYRTMIGDMGYKIHIIYNCTAISTKKSYRTISSNTEPSVKEWSLTAIPPPSTTYRSSAHFMIDSTKTSQTSLAALEDVLYGTSSTDPSIPTPEYLLNLF